MSSLKWANAKRCLLAAASFSLIAAQPRPAEKYRLAGRVVDALNAQPIIDVALILSTTNWQSTIEPVTPDAEGRFVFEGLPEGQYILSAARADFGTILFGELPDPGSVETIHVGPGKEGELLVFRIVPRSSVSGVVRDELGDPMVRASVSLSRLLWADGAVVTHRVNQASTDDRGQYRIGNVAPGLYMVCADAAIGRNTIAPSLGHVDFLSRGSSRYYAHSCANTVSIAPGQAAAASLTVASTSAVRVRGRIVNSLPNMGVACRLVPDAPVHATDQLAPEALDLAKGTFEFRGVQSGKYRLEADLTGRTSQGQIVSRVARLPIVVGSEDLENVELALEPTGEIEVVLHSTDDNKLDTAAVQIGLRSTTPDRYGTRWASAEDGPLRIAALPSGVYWLITRSKMTACVQSATLRAEEALHGSVTVTAAMAGQLDVMVSTSCGRINGRVIAGEQPVPRAKVLLLLSGTAVNPGDLVTAFADERGEFSFWGLPFGHYLLWAWSVNESSSFVGPISLATQENRAITVAVSSDEPLKVELPALKPEGH